MKGETYVIAPILTKDKQFVIINHGTELWDLDLTCVWMTCSDSENNFLARRVKYQTCYSSLLCYME